MRLVRNKIQFIDEIFFMLDSSEILSLYGPLSEIEEIHWMNNVIFAEQETFYKLHQNRRPNAETK